MGKRKGKPKPGLVTGHEQIGKLISKFLQNAVSLQTDIGVAKARHVSGGWRLHSGMHLISNQQLKVLQKEITDSVVRRVGPHGYDGREIDSVLWDEVALLVQGGSSSHQNSRFKAAVFSILKAIDAGSNQCQQLFLSNHLVGGCETSHSVNIGPVNIFETTVVRGELDCVEPSLVEWSDWNTDFMWRVETVCARSKSRAQAEWYIDIACGVLAICEGDLMQFDIYRVGWQMFHPTETRERFTRELVLYEGRLAERNAMNCYKLVLNDSFVKLLISAEFKARCSELFGEDDENVGVRLGVALGWLARGLQASKLETRLLFFSTALESILVTGGEGITDQLGRHGASILTDDVVGRMDYAAIIRDLYVSRSRLVHDGDRALHRIDVNSLEFVTFKILHEIWEKAELSMSFKVFGKLLKKSAFGTPMQWHE